MARKIYDSNRQFNDEKEVTGCNFSLWDNIPKELITMHHRVTEVLGRQILGACKVIPVVCPIFLTAVIFSL